MKTKIKIQKVGGSLMLIIPKLYCEHIDINENSFVWLQDDSGKYGKFISFWKSEDSEEQDKNFMEVEK